MPSHKLRILFFKEGDWWSAQCVEYDIAAQGRSLSDARYEIERTIITHLQINAEASEAPFHGLPKAPANFAKLFVDNASPVKRLKTPAFSLPKNVPPAYMCVDRDLRVMHA